MTCRGKSIKRSNYLAPVAQGIGRQPPELKIAGSNPAGRTIKDNKGSNDIRPFIISEVGMNFEKPESCLVRQVPASFARCLRSNRAPIDVRKAQQQHRAYCHLLERVIGKVTILPAEPEYPDCCYIEDTAVVINKHAVITRPGAPSRRGEIDAVEKVLGKWCETHRMPAPACLDGGDVMRIGPTLLAGLSDRTNRQGADFLREIATLEGVDVIAVPVGGGLHLKSACSLVDGNTVVFDPKAMNPLTLPDLDLTWLSAPEPLGANVLALGETLILSDDAPKTAALLRSSGHPVETVCVSELHKGDGALTCLSIRIPPKSGWSA